MKKALIIILILAFLGVGSVFAMSVPNEIFQPKVFVIETYGQNQLKRDNQWVDLKEGEELKEKDIIKTGVDGEVSINFYDNSTSRIGPKSEISFEELFIDDSNYGKTKIGLMVSIGRVWSRIIQLTDKEASFEVGSSATVATVRGTTFDFEVDEEGIAKINVVESIVEVSTIEFEEEIDQTTGEIKKIRKIIAQINLVEGNLTRIDQKKEIEELKRIEKEAISEETKKEKWFEENIEKDEKFEEEIKEKQREIIEEMAGILPDSGLYGIKKMAENIRLVLTNDPEKERQLEASYTSRRLAEAQELAQMGKKELAQETMEEFEIKAEEFSRERKELEKNGEDFSQIEMIENQIRNQINIQKEVLKGITPDQEIHTLKIELEKIEINNFTQEEEKEFLMFKQAEERLKEAEKLKEEEKEQLYQETFKEYQEQVQELKEENSDSDLIERIELKRDIIQNSTKESSRQEIKEILEPIKEEEKERIEIEQKENLKEELQKTEIEIKEREKRTIERQTINEEIIKEELKETNQFKSEIIDQKADINSFFEEILPKKEEKPIIQEPEPIFREPINQEPKYERPIDKEPEYQETNNSEPKKN